MKKAIQLSFLFLLFASLASPAQAQLLKKLQEKVNKKLEQELETEVDKETDKALDEIMAEDSSQVSDEAVEQTRVNAIMASMKLGGEPIPIEDSYRFQSKIQMHIETYDSQGKQDSKGDFITWTNPGEANFAYQFTSGNVGDNNKALIIMDSKNHAMIMLNQEGQEKTGLVYGYNPESFSDWADSDVDTDENPDIENINYNQYLKKTGRTKEVAGYSCEEYRYSNPEENSEASFWISSEVEISTKDLVGEIFKSANYASGMPWGFVMELESWDKDSQERSFMQVTDIDKKANANFDLSGYQINNLGSINIPTE